MKITTERAHSLRYCEDCGSEHMNAPCGMKYVDRLRSVRLDSSVTETRTKHNYFDDDALTGTFGKTAAERHEEMMEETQGVGVATTEEINEHPDLAAAHYLGV